MYRNPLVAVTLNYNNYNYLNRDFKAFRHCNYLLNVTHVPLTMQHLTLPLELVEVQRNPLFLPHDPCHCTIMADEFRYILYSLDTYHYSLFKENQIWNIKFFWIYHTLMLKFA